MDIYTSGTGQRLRVHDADVCAGPCAIHAPSAHHMRTWPTTWRPDRYMMERLCKHGVGHPDPDEPVLDRAHGCCGCCTPFPDERTPR